MYPNETVSAPQAKGCECACTKEPRRAVVARDRCSNWIIGLHTAYDPALWAQVLNESFDVLDARVLVRGDSACLDALAARIGISPTQSSAVQRSPIKPASLTLAGVMRCWSILVTGRYICEEQAKCYGLLDRHHPQQTDEREHY